MALKSYIYDDVNYRSTDAMELTIAAGNAAASAKFTTFTTKQIKSLTLVPTVASAASDVNKVVQLTTLPVSFSGGVGTATGIGGTATSTVTVNGVGTFGSGSVTAQYIPISGGTFASITVVQGAGTTTATNAVLPSGPNGGLTMGTGDLIYVVSGTDTVVTYSGELEYQYTPGSQFTI